MILRMFHCSELILHLNGSIGVTKAGVSDSTKAATTLSDSAKAATSSTKTTSSKNNKQKKKQSNKPRKQSAPRTSSTNKKSSQTGKSSATPTPSRVASRPSPSGGTVNETTSTPSIPPPKTKTGVASQQTPKHNPAHNTDTTSPPPPLPTHHPPLHPDDIEEDGPTPEEKRAMDAEMEAMAALKQVGGAVSGGSVFDELD